MPRLKGHDGEAVNNRSAEESKDFHLRFALFDLELLSLQITQLRSHFDRPPELIDGMEETTERITKYVKESIKS